MDTQKKEPCDSTLFLNNHDKGGNSSTKGRRQPCCPQRWIMAYMGLWFGIMLYIFSANMSVAIVCMVRDPADADDTTQTFANSTPDWLGRAAFNNSTSSSTSSHVTMGNRHVMNMSSAYWYQADEPEVEARNAPDVDVRDVNDWPRSASESEPPGLDNGLLPVGHVPEVHACSRLKGRDRMSPNGEFTWDTSTQSLVLSGFFYGYMVTQVSGGWLAARFGGKITIGTCMGFSSILTLLTPTLARVSPYALMAARIIIGLCSGISTPSWFALTGAWALPNERSRFIGLVWFGQMAGTIFAYTSSGFLCAYGFDNGWASIFYVDGLVGILFVVCWWSLVYSSPASHPRLTTAEEVLIYTHNQPVAKTKSKLKTPWCKIFTSVPVYALIITHICDTWTFYLLLTCLPKYIKDVLKFDIQSNGVFSSLPFLCTMAGIAVASVLADYIRSKGCFTITTIRKLFQITGFIGVATFIVVPGYLGCEERELVIFSLCMCAFFESLGFAGGYTCNAVDLTPKYSSVIFAISNTIATIPGIVAPVVVGALTKNQTSEEWRLVLFTAAGVAIFGAVIYGLFASSELLPWSDEKRLEIEVKVENKSSDDL